MHTTLNGAIIKVTTMKNMNDFHCERKPSHVSTKLTLFAISKDEWHTKEDAVKSIKDLCVYCSIPKGTFQAEAMSNSEKL